MQQHHEQHHSPQRTVTLIDVEQRWVRHPSDLVAAILCALGMAFVGFVSIYGHSTAIAVTSDVRSATRSVLGMLLELPVNLLEGLLSFVLPVVIVAVLVVRRRWRTLAATAIAGTASVFLSGMILVVMDRLWPESAFTGDFSAALQEQTSASIIASTLPKAFSFFPQIAMVMPYVALIAALLSTAGARSGSGRIKLGWWLLGIVVGLSVLKGDQSFIGATITILLGVLCGMMVRWIIGTEPRRAGAAALVNLIRRAGIDPVSVTNVGLDATDEALRAWKITTSAPIGYSQVPSFAVIRKFLSSSSEAAIAGDHSECEEDPEVEVVSEVRTVQSHLTIVETNARTRNYVVRTIDGREFHVRVFDQDQRILGVLDSLWEWVRLRTSIRHSSRTIEGEAEHLALMMLRTEQTLVAPKEFWSVAAGEDSIAIVAIPIEDTLLRDIPRGQAVSDTALDTFWEHLLAAHRAGLSHCNIHAGTVTFDGDSLQLRGWHEGSITSHDAARMIDLAQTIAMFAAIVGTDRAVSSLTRTLTTEQIFSLAPFLQRSILPARTRELYESRKVFQQLRDAISESVPVVAEAEQIPLKRFSVRTVLMIALGVVVVYVLLGSLNFAALSRAFYAASPMWLLVAFAFGLLTYVGQGLTLQGFTPEPLRYRDTLLVQVANSMVALVVPASVGPAAMNLKFLRKRGVGTTAALATVTVVQIAQAATTLIVLLFLALLTGDLGALSLPSPAVLVGIGAVVVVVVALLLVKPIRMWVNAKMQPVLNQILPRMVWLGTHPRQLALGLGGSALNLIAFIACFGFTLYAFGYHLPIVTLSITFLIANSVANAVPSPGGLGAVEAALTGGLVIAGVPYSVAFSAVLIYRLFIMWGRAPLGAIATKQAQARGIL